MYILLNKTYFGLLCAAN